MLVTQWSLATKRANAIDIVTKTRQKTLAQTNRFPATWQSCQTSSSHGRPRCCSRAADAGKTFLFCNRRKPGLMFAGKSRMIPVSGALKNLG
jgi:hypothetical protein